MQAGVRSIKGWTLPLSSPKHWLENSSYLLVGWLPMALGRHYGNHPSAYSDCLVEPFACIGSQSVHLLEPMDRSARLVQSGIINATDRSFDYTIYIFALLGFRLSHQTRRVELAQTSLSRDIKRSADTRRLRRPFCRANTNASDRTLTSVGTTYPLVMSRAPRKRRKRLHYI